jgi:hypothetical protein
VDTWTRGRVDAWWSVHPMRLKTLNGAPLPQYLDFSEDVLLTPDECSIFTIVSLSPTPSSNEKALKWWRLAGKETRLHTGWSQPYLPGSGRRLDKADMPSSLPYVERTSASFGLESTHPDTTTDIDEQPPTADTFLEHSLIFHDTLLSSQVVQSTVADQTMTSSSFLTTSFATTASDLSSPSRTEGRTLILQVPPSMTITPLGALPSAQRLRSIYPQTPTPNTLCVLMAPPERRDVYVRKGGYNMDLYEITVADDTKSGFKVTFWIRPLRDSNEQSRIQQPLLQTLQALRVGDILLLRNIALTSYRDTVYGQSLNPSIARARTTIDVMMKSTGVSARRLEGLPEVIVEAFKRVRQWARTHVAVTDGASRKRRGTSTGRGTPGKRTPASSLHDESLPPDTMESI